MANWFEDVTRTMADDKLSRRAAMRRIASTVVGAALASVVPGAVQAKNKACPMGGNCTIGFTNCQGNPNTNCFCFTDIDGKAKCGCNSFCSGGFDCIKDFNCAKGSICITLNGCTGCGTGGMCVFKCKGKNKNCTLGNGHGVTAAR